MAQFDSNGVVYLYQNNGGFLSFGAAENGGTRWDLINPPLNCEFTGYFQGGSSDDMSAKIRGGKHTDSAACDGCCYIPACPTGGGAPRYRTECPHDGGSTYADAQATQHASCQSFSSYKGLKAVVWNTANNCVHWEFWQDQGNNSGGTPANQWIKLMSRDDCTGDSRLSNCGGGPLLRPRGSTSQFTWRADGGPSAKWLSAVELLMGNPQTNPGGSGTGGLPIPGGGGVPVPGGGGGPIGNGGGGAGSDSGTGTGGGTQALAGKNCAIAVSGGITVTAGSCAGTGIDDLPGIGDGAGGATEPKPLVTVFKDTGFLWNIRTDLFDNCTVTGDPNVTDFKEIYSVAPVENEYISLFKNSDTQYYGVKLHSSRSVLYNKKIRKVAVVLKRVNPDPVVLSGDIKLEIRDVMGHVIYECEDTFDPATIELTDTEYEFETLDCEHKLEAGDSILITYSDSGDTANHIKVGHSPVEAIDGFNSIFVQSSSGIDFDADQLADAAFKISV